MEGRYKGRYAGRSFLPIDIPQAFPVVTDPQGQRGWQPIDWKAMKELTTAISQYGLTSTYTQQMLSALFSSTMFTPKDCHRIAGVLFTPSQMLHFKSSFENLADRAADNNAQRGSGDPLLGVTFDMIMGRGRFGSGNVQVHFATEVLQQSQELALAALKSVPETGKPKPSYVAIKQGQSEPYMQFIDRLTEAVERNIDLAPSARESVLMSLIMENANPVCKRILQALPKSAGLQEMMDACSKIGTAEEKASFLANAFTAAVKPLIQGRGDCGSSHATLDAHASVPVEPSWINFKKIAFIYTFAQKIHFYFEEMQYLSMAMIGVAFSLGFTVGPMIGAYLAMETEKGEVFYLRSALVALMFAVADLVFIFFLLPETLPKEKRVSSVTSGFQAAVDLLSPLALFQFSAVTRGKESLSEENLQNLKILGLAYFLYLFLFSGLEYTLSFLTHQRFQFSSMQQGKMFFFIGITMAVIQGGYARRIKTGNEIRAIKRAIILLIPAFLLIGWAANVAMLGAGLLLYSCAAAIVIPCLSAVVSGYGSAGQKGRVMGILRSLGALARALGPILSATVYWLAGAEVCFTVCGVCFLIPFALLGSIKEPLKEE